MTSSAGMGPLRQLRKEQNDRSAAREVNEDLGNTIRVLSRSTRDGKSDDELDPDGRAAGKQGVSKSPLVDSPRGKSGGVVCTPPSRKCSIAGEVKKEWVVLLPNSEMVPVYD